MTTLEFVETNFNYVLEQLGQMVSVELPAIKWLPTDVIPTIQFVLINAPNALSLIQTSNQAKL